MVCLLCYDWNSDFISISSDESVQFKIASILFKHFRFIFEIEPDAGEICRKCWMKVEMFDTFYQRIEEIQSTVIQAQPIVVENLNVHTKLENSHDSIANEREYNIDNDTNVETIDEKYDPHFDNHLWNDNLHASPSEYPNIETNPENKSKQHGSELKVTKSANVISKLKNSTKKKVESSTKNVKSNSNQEHCPINRKCTQEFETQDELIAHCALEHKRYHCTHCPNVRVFADLYKHLREVHGIIENAICEHCGQIFGCNRTLQDHIKRKHTISDPVQCDICKEWFKSRETIRSHMNYVHVQGTQTCTICGKISANLKALRTHLTIHSEAWKDRFKCVICGKGFRSSTKLREHSYIHSGKTDAYICQFCGKSFRFNSSISAHRMKHHPVEMAHVKERLQKKRNMEFKV